MHFLRQVGFFRTRRTAIEGTAATDTSPFAAPATILRGLAARRPILAVPATAPFLAIRPRSTAVVVAPLVAGVTTPPRVTALVEITATLETTAFAGRSPAGIASVAGIVTAAEPTPLARITPASVAPTGGIVTAAAESTAGLAAIEASASTGLAAGTEPASRLVTPLAGLAPASEAAAFTGVLTALEAAPLAGPTSTGRTATAPGFFSALETTALGCVASAAEATGGAAPVPGILASESAALARTAALVVTAATIPSAAESAGIVAALETTSVGRTLPLAVAARFVSARRAASFPRIATAVEPAAASIPVRLVTPPAGPGVWSAATEGLPIVVLVRHGAPFLGFAK